MHTLAPIIAFHIYLRSSSNLTLFAARGCSSKLKRLRKHELYYQQKKQARQNCDHNNEDKCDGIILSADKYDLEATAKVSAAVAEIIHISPTMGQKSLKPTSPLLQTSLSHGLFCSIHDASSFQRAIYSTQQSNKLPNPNTKIQPHLFPSEFDSGSTPQEERLKRMMEQR